MQKIVIRHGQNLSNEYKVLIGSNILNEFASLYDFNKYSKILIVSDKNIAPLLLARLQGALPVSAAVILAAGEPAKHTESVAKIWQALQTEGCDRKSLVINLGGGVIGDIGGFAASTYMRGIGFLNVPTTLLAQVDANIGGKTGFNFAGIKNIIGSFSQPIGVVIDPEVLATLPDREFASGFGEIIKHGLIADKTHFEHATSKSPREFNSTELEDIITASCRIKADVVESDETEQNIRKVLNFGHTIGHAIEALSLEQSNPLLHGEAVSIGMMAEAHISHSLQMLSEAEVEQIQEALVRANLPVTVSNLSVHELQSKMQFDKKTERGTLQFTLLEAIGKACFNQPVPGAVIDKALRSVLIESST